MLWTVRVYVCVIATRVVVAHRTKRKTIRQHSKPFTCVLWLSGDSLLPAHHCRVCKMETTITILHTTLHSNVLFRSRVFISKLFIANFLRENEKKWKERRRRGIERREKKENWTEDSHREFYCKFYHLLLLVSVLKCTPSRCRRGRNIRLVYAE